MSYTLDSLQIYHLLGESESLCRFATTLRTEHLWFRRWRWLLNLLMPSCSLDSNRYCGTFYTDKLYWIELNTFLTYRLKTVCMFVLRCVCVSFLARSIRCCITTTHWWLVTKHYRSSTSACHAARPPTHKHWDASCPNASSSRYSSPSKIVPVSQQTAFSTC